MYIPYYELAQSISKILPKAWQKKFVDYGYNLKIKQNLDFINKNIVNVKKRLSKKIKTQKLNVIFYVYDDTKWKCQSLYDLMDKSENFIPYIYVTKNAAPQNNCNYQTDDDLRKVYDFFAKKSMRVKYAYNIEKQKYIPFEKMNPKPDIIIYQHPWYVERTQGPVVCSKFALTYYVPYYISDTDEWFEYDLRFHKYIYKYFVPSDIVRKNYAKKMSNNGKNLVVSGHPQLDYFYLNKNNSASDTNNKVIIYAPHWTVCGDNIRYSTFDWSGREILEFAKSHKEFNWVMKPHPLLYNFLYQSGYMSKNETDKYFDDWREIGQVFDSGDYMELFSNSSVMITDSGSFLIEYLLTRRPCIHLVSEKFIGNETAKQICEGYYNAHNKEEMYSLLNEVILANNDSKKSERDLIIQSMNLDNNYAAQNIVNEIINDL